MEERKIWFTKEESREWEKNSGHIGRKRKCAFCGDPYVYGWTKYCCQRCQNDDVIKRRKDKVNAKRLKHAFCFCGKPIEQGNHKVRLYCSISCKHKALRMRKKCPTT